MEAAIPVIEESKKLDLLDRQEFVDRMLTITKVLSDSKKNACYAVNGDWGVGKSFVLDMFEEQAGKVGVEGETRSRYLIFRYNCWEYDYYEEPLVAIVASMLDQIDEQVDLLSVDIKTRIVAALKVIGKGLTKRAIQLFEEKTGVDLEQTVEVLIDGGEAAKKKVKESHEYDQYFDFKKNLKKLRETMAFLSAEQTVIFIVDELDRCLPEYTIKVLERLHHLFEGIPNVQVILSIDVGQLEHVVRQIYGENTDAKNYLRKFIQFELILDTGNLNNKFSEKFEEYTEHFSIQSPTTADVEVLEFIKLIFYSMDMRSRISIISRCELLHHFLIDDGTVDSSYMCLEILLVLLKDSGFDHDRVKNFSISSVFNPAYFVRELPEGIKALSEKFKSNRASDANQQKLYESGYSSFLEQTIGYVNAGCLLGKLLCAFRVIAGIEKDNYQYIQNERDFYAFLDDARKCWSFLEMIQ